MATEVTFIKTFLGKLGSRPIVLKADYEPPADEPTQPLPAPSRPFELKYAQTSTALDHEEETDQLPSSGPIEITVKQMKGGKSFVIRATGGETVETLKVQVAEASGISADTQRLVFSGKALQDDRTLASYGLANGATLHLMLKPASAQQSTSPSATGPQPSQESPVEAPTTKSKTLQERLKDLLSKDHLWKAIGEVLASHDIDEDLRAAVLERFRGAL